MTPEPLDGRAIVASVSARGNDTAAALPLDEILGEHLLHRRPRIDALDEDVDRAVALWSPAVRAARRNADAARAAARSAGAPAPAMLEGETDDLRGPGDFSEVALMASPLEILGIGRAGAERDAAVAATVVATARVEAAWWDARFEVFAARVRFAGARERMMSFDVLKAAIEPASKRFRLLDERRRVSDLVRSRRDALLAEIDEMSDMERSELAAAIRELNRAAGVVPNSRFASALATDDLPRDRTREHIDPADAEGIAHTLLARRADLWVLRCEYGAREADLRLAVSRTWPDLRIGPKLVIESDDLLPGGIFAIELPLPGSEDGRIEAARLDRLAAREMLEDGLAAAIAEVNSAASRLDALEAAQRAATLRLEASRRALDSAASRFLIDGDTAEQWLMAVSETARAIREHSRAGETRRLALLEFEKSLGTPLVERSSESGS